ncbi:DUF4249 domain-containing protein [Larkinella bovis]|uniref:DUF4249 domain-containing protein n=1 Tax=Larkinella bovis TaxID=683041 RepID=A0ABW0IFT4_9BACT
MRISFTILLAVLLASLTACESLINEVDPDRLPTIDEKLVVQCFISPQDTLLMATVSRSRAVLGSGQGGVVGASRVVLSEGNRSIVMTFDEKLLAFVADPRQFPIEAGKTYHLRAELDKQVVTASCTVPEAVPITSVKLDSTRETSPFWSQQFPWVYETRLSWQDPGHEANYYRVAGEASLSQWVTLNRYIPNQTAPDTLVRFVTMRSPVFFNTVQQYLSDRNQNGQSITSPKGIIPNNLHFTYYDRASNTYFGGYASISRRPVTLTLMLLHVDKNYYDYHRTLQQQNDIEGNPFSEPVLVATNIEGGLGCFAAYNRSALAVTLK